jgi:cytochrome c oxidase assembly factor CtaG/ferredoxin
MRRQRYLDEQEMSPSLAIAQSWTLPLWPTLGILIAGILYLRGWRLARITRPRELPVWRAACFFAGLLSLWIALASPLDALNEFLLVAHMTQHLLLMSIAPPLLLLGNPVVPILRGLPRAFVRDELAPWMSIRAVHRLERLFTDPVFGWIALDAAIVVWHWPAAYELALRSSFWHQMEHACFFFAALSFWWYVVRPWPNRIRSSRWMIVPYLATAHMIFFFVGLIIALDGHVIYPSYAHVPRLFGISALTDQALAGGEMIIVGLTVIIFALVPIMLQLLSDHPQPARSASHPVPRTAAAAPAPFDFLHAPITGPALRSRYGRRTLQTFSVAAMALVIVDGLRGVQIAPLNLAGAFLWNVLRPLNLILLLLVANFFCFACPFTLPRELARRFRIPQLRWPEKLSSKWPAAVLLLLFFWAYEQFALWNSPRDTALLLLAYVVAATTINSVFTGASFCKYVCPVGQFNFIASLFAPLELGVRSSHVCSSCATHDCVRGNAVERGCELKLYLPNKIGNLDCTLCLDCVHACPSDNVSLTPQSPLRELARDPVRSSIGRISARPDIAALILVVIFSSLANAAVMIAPVAHFLSDFRQHHPWAAGWSISLLTTLIFSAVLFLLYLAAARLMQTLTARRSLRTVFCRFSIALLPLGLSIWLGHLAFHLATSWSSIPAMFQHVFARAATAPHSMAMAATSASMFAPFLGPNGTNLFDLQVWIVNLGLFVSWYAGWKLIRQMAAPVPASSSARSIRSMIAVWLAGSTAFYAVAVWIFTQPMYMRGMGM